MVPLVSLQVFFYVLGRITEAVELEYYFVIDLKIFFEERIGFVVGDLCWLWQILILFPVFPSPLLLVLFHLLQLL